MPTLPQLSGRETVQAYESLGWKVARQKGSHIILIKDGHVATLSVPDHKEVAKGTLRSLIRSAGLTVLEFLFVLKKIAFISLSFILSSPSSVFGPRSFPPRLLSSVFSCHPS